MSTTKVTKTAKVDAKAADKEIVKTAAKVEAPKVAAKAEAPKAEASKTEKAETVKKAPAKATVKKAPAEKKAPAKKAVVAKTAVKKAPAKKAAKATEEIFIEYGGSQVSTAEITARVVEATGKKASSIKALNIYVQPETGKIYYTADGVSGEIAY